LGLSIVKRILLPPDWVAALAAALLFAACASTPEASPEADQRAKEFHTHPNASAIYVYRSEFSHWEEDSVLFMDGRIIGATLPGTFFRIDATPGPHVLHGTGHDMGTIALDTMAGELYFVSLDVIGGHSRFQLVPARVGESRVRDCCAMLEKWTPGQRPLLR
jgi:hypothetical protein